MKFDKSIGILVLLGMGATILVWEGVKFLWRSLTQPRAKTPPVSPDQKLEQIVRVSYSTGNAKDKITCTLKEYKKKSFTSPPTVSSIEYTTSNGVIERIKLERIAEPEQRVQEFLAVQENLDTLFKLTGLVWKNETADKNLTYTFFEAAKCNIPTSPPIGVFFPNIQGNLMMYKFKKPQQSSTEINRSE